MREIARADYAAVTLLRQVLKEQIADLEIELVAVERELNGVSAVQKVWRPIQIPRAHR